MSEPNSSTPSYSPGHSALLPQAALPAAPPAPAIGRAVLPAVATSAAGVIASGTHQPPVIDESRVDWIETLQGAPPWLVSLVIHMLVLICLGLMVASLKEVTKVNIEAVYGDDKFAEEIGDQLRQEESVRSVDRQARFECHGNRILARRSAAGRASTGRAAAGRIAIGYFVFDERTNCRGHRRDRCPHRNCAAWPRARLQKSAVGQIWRHKNHRGGRASGTGVAQEKSADQRPVDVERSVLRRWRSRKPSRRHCLGVVGISGQR